VEFLELFFFTVIWGKTGTRCKNFSAWWVRSIQWNENPSFGLLCRCGVACLM